jgi:hypothetical protein
MRSINKCAGVSKTLPKSVKVSRKDKKRFSKLPQKDFITTEHEKVNYSLENHDLDTLGILEGKIPRDCLADEEKTNPASMKTEDPTDHLESPGKVTVDCSLVGDSNESFGDRDVVMTTDDDSDVEILTETELIQRRANVDDNSKGTQADFSPVDKHKNIDNKKQCIIKKIKRLKTQTTSTSSPVEQEKIEKERELFSSSECNIRLEQDGGLPGDKDYEDSLSPVSQPGSCEKNSTSTFESTEPNRSPNTRPSKKGEDIPLMANVDEVHVNHYVLDLAVDFEQKVMRGSIVLFLEPASEEVTGNTFQLCLDSTLVNVESVCEVFLPEDFEMPFFWRKSSTEKNCSGDSVTTDSAKTGKDNINCGTVEPKDVGVPTCDQSGLNEITSSNKTDCLKLSSKGPELSLFQRLQQNFGIGSAQNSPESSKQQTKLSEGSTEANASDDINSLGDNSSLPEFLKLLGAKCCDHKPLPYKGLTYSVYGWCIKVWKEGATGKAWPRCVCIKYHTSPEGQSLMWTNDQDGKYVESPNLNRKFACE